MLACLFALLSGNMGEASSKGERDSHIRHKYFFSLVKCYHLSNSFLNTLAFAWDKTEPQWSLYGPYGHGDFWGYYPDKGQSEKKLFVEVDLRS